MAAPYRVWGDGEWIEVPVPPDDEITVVPNINALIYRDLDRSELLLQRRDKPGEVVRGRWELPGGRWMAGEPPDVAIAREVREETGLTLLAVAGAVERLDTLAPSTVWIARPLAVVAGVDGAYPSMHVVFECYAEGDPRPLAGETADTTWWQVEELREEIAAHPERFVAQTLAMLAAALPE